MEGNLAREGVDQPVRVDRLQQVDKKMLSLTGKKLGKFKDIQFLNFKILPLFRLLSGNLAIGQMCQDANKLG
jgi:hypothetical protein